MAKCVNCVKDAAFVYNITNSFKLNYCQQHMPKALLAGNVTGVERLATNLPSAVEAVSKVAKKKPVVVEEPPVVEEEVAPAPAVEEPTTDAAD